MLDAQWEQQYVPHMHFSTREIYITWSCLYHSTFVPELLSRKPPAPEMYDQIQKLTLLGYSSSVVGTLIFRALLASCYRPRGS